VTNPDVDPLNFPFPEQLPNGPEAGQDDDQVEDDEEADGPNTGEQIDAVVEHEAQQRLWLRAIIPLLNLRSHETDPSGRVQLAFDLMHIAACERVGRLMRADLRVDRG
jgi:hypothetical protein